MIRNLDNRNLFIHHGETVESSSSSIERIPESPPPAAPVQPMIQGIGLFPTARHQAAPPIQVTRLNPPNNG